VALSRPWGRAAIRSVVIIGGGLAGLSAACALADSGFAVTLCECRRLLGGRASSLLLRGIEEPVDLCPHVLLRCCTHLLDFYRRLGITDRVRFLSRVGFLDRQGRLSWLGAGRLPAPLHLLPAFARLPFLGAADKRGVARALVAMLRGPEAADAPFAAWLARQRQTPRAIEAFWRPLVVSALNEEPERVSTRYAFLVFRDGFLRHHAAYQVGIPTVPLSVLHGPPCRDYLARRGARVLLKAPVRQVLVEGDRATGVRLEDGTSLRADWVIAAVPAAVLPGLLPPALAAAEPFAAARRLRPSPITALHLWFDRPVTPLDHAALVDRTVQWVFVQDGGSRLSLVISASCSLVGRPRAEVLGRALAEIREAFPAAREAHLRRSAVLHAPAATFSPAPGCDGCRPLAETPLPGLFLAGDWTRTGWPATMESAVRSGTRAAEAILKAAGCPRRLVPSEPPPAPLARLLGGW